MQVIDGIKDMQSKIANFPCPRLTHAHADYVGRRG